MFIHAFGKTRGAFKNKENRVQKLLESWDELKSLMQNLVTRGHGRTETARCAFAILLMMETGIRVGNESSAEGYICNNKYLPEYGKTIQTYGLTTLKIDHVAITSRGLVLNFVGKKGVEQKLRTNDHFLLQYAQTVSTAHDIDTWIGISYPMIKRFVKKHIGKKFQPKDIRTVVVNIKFAKKLKTIEPLAKKVQNKKEAKAILKSAIISTAEEIGHTPGVCKSAYITKFYMEKVFTDMMKKVEQNKAKRRE